MKPARSRPPNHRSLRSPPTGLDNHTGACPSRVGGEAREGVEVELGTEAGGAGQLEQAVAEDPVDPDELAPELRGVELVREVLDERAVRYRGRERGRGRDRERRLPRMRHDPASTC